MCVDSLYWRLSFEKEKRNEDDALDEILRGVPLGGPEAATDQTRRPFVVPPTALAFEHRALAAPADPTT